MKQLVNFVYNDFVYSATLFPTVRIIEINKENWIKKHSFYFTLHWFIFWIIKIPKKKIKFEITKLFCVFVTVWDKAAPSMYWIIFELFEKKTYCSKNSLILSVYLLQLINYLSLNLRRLFAKSLHIHPNLQKSTKEKIKHLLRMN